MKEGGVRLGCQPSKLPRRKEGQVLVVGMCRPWFQRPESCGGGGAGVGVAGW